MGYNYDLLRVRQRYEENTIAIGEQDLSRDQIKHACSRQGMISVRDVELADLYRIFRPVFGFLFFDGSRATDRNNAANTIPDKALRYANGIQGLVISIIGRQYHIPG
jgi:hypothetical protein